jgi:hypothetical protein
LANLLIVSQILTNLYEYLSLRIKVGWLKLRKIAGFYEQEFENISNPTSAEQKYKHNLTLMKYQVERQIALEAPPETFDSWFGE